MLQDKKADLLSDHLPQLFSIGQIKCLNWNIMHPYSSCGYSPYGDFSELNSQIHLTELERQNAEKVKIKERALRIHACLCAMVKEQQPHFITLQENFLDEKQLQELCNSLGLHWQFIFNRIRTRQVILFNSSMILSLDHSWSNLWLTAQFRSTEHDINMVVHNVHFDHEEVSFETEADTLKLLHCATGKSVIVIGDFNSRIAPITDEPTVIITSVTPKMFRDGFQGCGWTDGCFTLAGDDTIPQQIDGDILDPKTGIKFRDNFTMMSYNTAMMGQRVELFRPRPFMDITGRYLTHFTQNGSLLEIEGQLSKALEDPALKLRMTVNAFNQRGYVIVSNSLEKYKQRYSRDIVTHAHRDSQTRIITMYCDITKLNEFYEMLIKSQTQTISYSFGNFFSRTEKIYHSDSSITDDLLSLSCFINYLPETPDEVDTIRQIKYQLIQMSKVTSEVIQLFAKLVLANYYLHFTEYNEIDRANMGDPKCLLLRPTHFQNAMGEYLAICNMFAQMNINTFMPVQRQIIKANLIELGNNITTVYDIFAKRLTEQVELFEKRLPKTQQSADITIITKTVSDLHRTYQRVLACQNILCSNAVIFNANDASSSADIARGLPPLSLNSVLSAPPPNAPASFQALSSATSPDLRSPGQLLSNAPLLPAAASSIPTAAMHPVVQSTEEKGAQSIAAIKITLTPINLVKSFLGKVYPTEDIKANKP